MSSFMIVLFYLLWAYFLIILYVVEMLTFGLCFFVHLLQLSVTISMTNTCSSYSCRAKMLALSNSGNIKNHQKSDIHAVHLPSSSLSPGTWLIKALKFRYLICRVQPSASILLWTSFLYTWFGFSFWIFLSFSFMDISWPGFNVYLCISWTTPFTDFSTALWLAFA